MYRFHLYFTVRKILYDIKCPIPVDGSFNQVNNHIDKRAYLDICREFKVDPHRNFKQSRDTTSNGLGTAYYLDNLTGTPRFLAVPGNDYNPRDIPGKVYVGQYAGTNWMGFGWKDPPEGSGHNSKYVISFLEQSPNVANAWQDFIPSRSQGLTQAGIIRINESIRAYVYALLGAQAQTKTSVLTYGTGLDAQRQFNVIVESLINVEEDIQTGINQFQDSL